MTRDDWLFEFNDEVWRAGLELGKKYVRTVALSQWSTHAARPPREVAKEWMRAREPVKPDAGRRR